MKKKYTLILLFVALGAIAQVDCKVRTQQATEILNSKNLYKDYGSIFYEILPCAELGDPVTQNNIGLMYANGLGIEKDESKGFAYIEQAAKSGNAIGQYNLGELYRKGQGCALDMDKAVEWYQKSADQKYARATYILGYMHLKGFGVHQDYDKAISWFKKSDYAMAKHWLGVCYYLGYGVPQDTDKALEYLYGNTTLNSRAFLSNLKIEKRRQVLNQAENAINEANKGDKKIDPVVIAENREMVSSDEAENQNIKIKNILGEWTGRLIEYDWSGTTPLRVLPIAVSFSKSKQGDLQTKINFEGKTFEDLALFKDNNLFVNDFKFTLDQLYLHNFKNDKLEYAVLGMNLSQKNYNDIPYLLVNVDSFIEYWKEPGPPISLVLRPKNNAVSAEDEALLLALASQKNEFIKVYPVPFNEQLYVGFELQEPAKVQVKLISVANAQTIQVAGTSLGSGRQSYTVNTTNLPNGFYVVQVQENEKTHTRIVIKQ
ncbi:T9SS type A sorting domain-containing protein [Flavobacterium sp. KMS]|uniref:T9SS type A sorting domain-containing protein n=1 Tax=Flavobacterium sp. KMS TaxID=1566023 RepID=UPI00068F6CB1|nr:T9SS type A sorting domain-containing protein [Flavobacterium sp. KMS]